MAKNGKQGSTGSSTAKVLASCPTAPWFKVFKGELINNFHLSLAEKRAAKEGRQP
jgi:hypothetical protein